MSLSMSLGASLWGCTSLGKKPAVLGEERNLTIVEDGNDDEASEDDLGLTNNEWRVVWALVEWEEKSERIITQGEADFEEGDTEYRQWTDFKGVRHIELNGPPRNPYFVRFEIHPDGTKVISHGNGKSSQMVEEKPGSRVYGIDIYGKGNFDLRVTITTLQENRIQYDYHKRNPDGTWDETRWKTTVSQFISCHF
jgi:hypothetical protein